MPKALTEQFQDQVMNSLHASAATLAEHSGGLFVAYPLDLKAMPFQSLSLASGSDHFRLVGDRLDIDDSDFLAGAVDRRYKGLPDVVADYDERTGYISRVIGGHLLAGDKVILGGEHDELIDAPFKLLAISNRLRSQGIAHRSAQVASKAIDFLGVNLNYIAAENGVSVDQLRKFLSGYGIESRDGETVHTREFLGRAADLTYFTIPSTQTFAPVREEQRNILQRLGDKFNFIPKYNEKVIGAVQDDLADEAEPPMLIDVELTGTTKKLLDVEEYREGLKIEGHHVTIPEVIPEGDEDIDVIGFISPGILRATGVAHTFVAPTVLRLDHVPPAIAIEALLQRVETVEDIGHVAISLIELSQAVDPGRRVIYDAKGNLPLIRKTPADPSAAGNN